MSRWKECKLGEIATIVDCEHKTAPTVDSSEFVSVRTANISNGRIDFKNSNRVSEGTYEIWTKRMKPKEGDIILAREAPVGEVGWVPAGKKVCLGQRTVLIRVNESTVSPRYLLYYLVSDDVKYDLISRSTGSVVEHLNVKDIKDFDLKIHASLEEQQSIASILSTLDDKIDLLHRQNATLEAMAETLFRQWFVEPNKRAEIKGIKASQFVDGTFAMWIAETVGGEWGKEAPEGDFVLQVNCIRGTDIADLNTGLPNRTPVRYVKERKFKAIEPREGDLIIEISGGTEDQSTGRTTYINADIKSLFQYPVIFSNFCRLLRIKRVEYTFFVYCYLQYLYNQDEFFNLENGSSGIKNLDYKTLLFDSVFAMPNADLVVLFNSKVEPLFKKINQNKKQVRTLTALRDTLLPKLMSGEVRVKECSPLAF